MEARLGVISPSGDFYPCGYACHTAMCAVICEKLGIFQDVPKYSEFALTRKMEAHGWVFVHMFIGSRFALCGNMNQIQREVADELIMSWLELDEEQSLNALTNDIERYGHQTWNKRIEDYEAFRQSLHDEHSDNIVKPTLLTPPLGLNINYQEINKRLNGD